MRRIFLGIVLILNVAIYAENNVTIDSNASIETCELVSEEAFGYTGDVSGKRLYTKMEYVYNCTRVEEKKGSCKTLKKVTEEIDLGKMKGTPVYYETENFEGSFGQMLSVTQAYDKINGMWAGWHGICQKGMDDDNFDWMTDPYVLAGYAMDAISGGFASASSAATATAKAADAAADAAKGTTWEAIKAAKEVASEAAIEAAKAKATESLVRMASCSVIAGIGVDQMVSDYYDDGEACDEIDEICDEEENGASDEGNIFTITADKYEEMLIATPESANHMVVLDGIGTEILTIKVTSSSADTSDMSSEKAKEAEKEAKLLQLKIGAAMTTLQTASCMLGGSSSTDQGGTDDDSSFTSTQNLTTMTMGAINPLLGMATDIAFRTYESLQTINTCSDEDDAKEKGSRHEATFHALQYGFCHKIEEIESGKSILTERTKYRFCCYNDKTTRVMVEQAKAQLAKDWTHCTDISPNELTHLSFKSCDPVELDSSINGVHLSAYAPQSERVTAYQFTHKCIDTREYIADMMRRFGGENMMLDQSTLEEMLQDFQ